MRRWSVSAALAAAALAGGVVAVDLLARTWPLGRLPMWDGAGNGWGAVELWSALAGGRPVDFLLRLNAQDKWPFGFSLLMLPFVAGGGGSFASATLLPALAFALVPPLLVWLAGEIDRDGRGLAAGLLAAALWLASATPRVLATVVMRETAGAALGVAVLAAWLRARRLGSLAAWRVCGGLLLAQFFVKYNYFLLSAAALALHFLLELDPAARRAAFRELLDRVLRQGWRSPLRWLALVALIAAIALAAGQNPGNFLYGALVLATLALLRMRWKSAFRLRRSLAALAPAPRALTETLVAPLWIWALSPSPIHPRDLIAFLRNREGMEAVFSPAALAFYPREFVTLFLPGEVAGRVISTAALAGLLALLARRGDPARALALTAAVGCVALTLHPLKEGRFLATLAPALFLVAAVPAVRLVAALLPRPETARFVSAAALLSLSFCGVSLLASQSRALSRLEIDHALFTGAPALATPLDDLARRVAGEGRPALVGGINELSESLVRWRVWQSERREARLVDPLRGLSGSDTPESVRARVGAWLDRERPGRVVAMVFPPGSPRLADRDFLLYNAWQIEAWRLLAASDAWRQRDRRRYPALGFELVTYLRERDER